MKVLMHDSIYKLGTDIACQPSQHTLLSGTRFFCCYKLYPSQTKILFLKDKTKINCLKTKTTTKINALKQKGQMLWSHLH